MRRLFRNCRIPLPGPNGITIRVQVGRQYGWQSRVILSVAQRGLALPEKRMKTFGVLTILTLALLPVAASAGDRGTDAALGAVSGAVVFGPVGAVAGALVGFTAGPAIGHSWGANGSGRSYRHRAQARATAESRAQYSEPATGAGAVQAAPVSGSVAPAAAPPRAAQNKAPPVQGLE